MTEIIEHVALAIQEAAEGPPGDFDQDRPHPAYVKAAGVAIDTVDAFRYAEKRKNCKHISRQGTGSISSDGFGWSTWYCAECGASYDSRSAVTPADKPNVGSPGQA
jgi:hypothetical protein